MKLKRVKRRPMEFETEKTKMIGDLKFYVTRWPNSTTMSYLGCEDHVGIRFDGDQLKRLSSDAKCLDQLNARELKVMIVAWRKLGVAEGEIRKESEIRRALGL